MNKIRLWLIKKLLTENEKSMLTQGLYFYESKLAIDLRKGTLCNSDFKYDTNESYYWRSNILENDLFC